jgi:hypothetical protein
MTKTSLFMLLVGALMAATFPLAAQQSDYAVKKSFEGRFADLKTRIDAATNTTQLDSLKLRLDSFELDFTSHKSFLDEVLYPESFDSKIKDLRGMYVQTYDRITLIQTQGVQITQMEANIKKLTSSLNDLSAERDRLFAELQENKANINALRETVRRLQANIQAKDRLIFALIDTIFMPYGRNLSQLSEVQRAAVNQKIENANIITRVNEIAADNMRFLQSTELQGKDFVNLIDQYNQFRGRWVGLREKIEGVTKASGMVNAPKHGAVIGPQPAPISPAAQIDTAVTEWKARLMQAFWAAVEREFTAKGVAVVPFNDAPGFSNSIRTYVQAAKAEGADARVFVDDIWKARIDKEWREALSRDGMLGKEEYAALDKLVSELHQEKLDMKFVLYVGALFLLVLALWWFLRQRSKPAAPPQQQT